MLYWAAVFSIIALIAAALGFGGIAGASAGIAKMLFFVFLIVFQCLSDYGSRTTPSVERPSGTGNIK